MSEQVHRIIDMRLRPPFLHAFLGAAPGTPEHDLVRWVNQRVGAADPEHFTRYATLDDVVAGMDAAGKSCESLSATVVIRTSTP